MIGTDRLINMLTHAEPWQRIARLGPYMATEIKRERERERERKRDEDR